MHDQEEEEKWQHAFQGNRLSSSFLPQYDNIDIIGMHGIRFKRCHYKLR